MSASVLLFAGCGRNYSGVYQGNEQLSQVGPTQPNQSPVTTQSPVTMTLNDNGSSITGTYQSEQSGAGQVTATATGNGLTNFSLTMMNTGGFYNTLGGCTPTYTGTLSSPNGNQLTGILVASGNAYYCGSAQSRRIDVTK